MYEQALQSNLSWTQHYFCIAGLIIDLPYEYFCGADGIWLTARDPLLAFTPGRKTFNSLQQILFSESIILFWYRSAI